MKMRDLLFLKLKTKHYELQIRNVEYHIFCLLYDIKIISLINVQP